MSNIIGQFRLTRMTNRDIAATNLFFGVRHYQHKKIPADYTIEDNTLFGEWGTDGEYLIPSVSRHLELLDAMPEMFDAITTENMQIHERRMEGVLQREYGVCVNIPYTTPPGECLSSWLNFHIYNHDSDPDHSYLVWNGIDEMIYLSDCVSYVSDVLNKMGYLFDEGTMIMERTPCRYDIVSVVENKIEYMTTYSKEFEPGKVATTYFTFPLSLDKPYVITLGREYCKIETLKGIAPIEETQDLRADDWVKIPNASVFLGFAYAQTERQALERFAEQAKIKSSFLTAYEV